MINGRRWYLAADQYFAIWFNGGSDWWVGRVIDMEAGKFSSGYVITAADSSCPNFNGLTREWTGAWTVNNNATLQCACPEGFEGDGITCTGNADISN